MRKRLVTVLALAVTATLAVALTHVSVAVSEETLPTKVDASCAKCHKYDQQPNVLAGKLADVSSKAKAISVKINKELDVVLFDDSTVLKNAEEFKKIPKDESVKITYYKKNGKTYAKEVEVKKGIEVPKEQLASVEDVAKLVAMGPEKGKYILLDSRPKPMYDQGHIPSAVAMPFPAFDKLAEKVLPKDKEITQIYYCAGFT